MNNDLELLMKKARNISLDNFGKSVTFYHPGMFRYEGKWGKYSAISITGNKCDTQCAHCRGRLLEQMRDVSSPDKLVRVCQELDDRGDMGCLITGGFRKDGTIPWDDFQDAIKTVKETTKLHISIHTGMLTPDTALKIKEAGVDLAMMDIIGDDETWKKIYGLDSGIDRLRKTIDALVEADMPIIPHIVVGMDHGRIKGEYEAIRLIRNYEPEAIVIVSLMPLPGTPMCKVKPPEPEEIAGIMATARIEMPRTPLSLGCARDRSKTDIDLLALDCGVNRIALPSERTIARAVEYEMKIEWQDTCCSVPFGLLGEKQ